MNTIGPYHNRQETYKYFSLPFCKGPLEEVGHHHETMGEALQGVELEFSGLQIGFKGEMVHGSLIVPLHPYKKISPKITTSLHML